MRSDAATDRGSGLIMTMLAVPLVLLLALSGAQLLLRLHATSTVRSLAGHAVRQAAIAPGSVPQATDRAMRSLREDLGPSGTTAHIDWAMSEDALTMRVRVEAPQLLPGLDIGPLAAPIVASVTARRERWA